MFLKSKKSLTWIRIIYLILAVCTMVLLLFYFTGWVSQNEYESKVLQCNIFFSHVDGKPDFFSKSLDMPSLKFQKTAADICPIKNFEVTKRSVRDAAYLVDRCYFSGALGDNFLGALVNDLSICLYCGNIISDEKINNFDELFLKEVRKKEYNHLFDRDVEVNNTNYILINDSKYIPKNVGEQNSIGVFYYIAQPDISCALDDGIDVGKTVFDCSDSLQRSFGQFVGSWSGFATSTAYLSSSSDDRPLGGIILSNIDESREDYFAQKSLKIGEGDKKFECDVMIIPEEILD